MADVQNSQLDTGVIYSATAEPLRASSLDMVAVYNFPSEAVQVTSLDITTVEAAPAVPVEISQLDVIVLYRGRTARSSLAAWTFEIDGHAYYVLQLQTETLIYDFHSERWYVWGSRESALWNVQIGQNWNANIGAIIANLGGEGVSNVVVGDDTTSALYFLDPGLSEDYSSLGSPGVAFKRVITGQLPSRGKGATKLSGVEVMSSEGFTVDAADMSVELEISDDQGVSYWSAGSRTVAEGTYATALDWRSLGSFRAPGRLLRLVDYGALRRVDDWTVPKDDD